MRKATFGSQRPTETANNELTIRSKTEVSTTHSGFRIHFTQDSDSVSNNSTTMVAATSNQYQVETRESSSRGNTKYEETEADDELMSWTGNWKLEPGTGKARAKNTKRSKCKL